MLRVPKQILYDALFDERRLPGGPWIAIMSCSRVLLRESPVFQDRTMPWLLVEQLGPPVAAQPLARPDQLQPRARRPIVVDGIKRPPLSFNRLFGSDRVHLEPSLPRNQFRVAKRRADDDFLKIDVHYVAKDVSACWLAGNRSEPRAAGSAFCSAPAHRYYRKGLG
jgi:hypothetical protein